MTPTDHAQNSPAPQPTIEAGRTENLNVTGFTPLVTPRALKAALPLSAAAERVVLAGRRASQDILHGRDDRLLVVVGPCSIHDFDEALEYAHRLAALRERVKDRLEVQMRVYVDKPRTTVGWRGYLMDPDMTGANDINRGLHLTRDLMIRVVGTGPARRHRTAGSLRAAVPVRCGGVGLPGRTHHRIADAPGHGERRQRSDGLQERHGRRPETGCRCHRGRAESTRLFYGRRRWSGLHRAYAGQP